MRAAQVLLLALLPTPGVRADEPKGKLDLLIGKWEVTSSKREPPVGSIIEFGKEGKMKITVKKNGDKETIDGVYKVIANTLHLTYKTGKKEDRKEPITIKRITDL